MNATNPPINPNPDPTSSAGLAGWAEAGRVVQSFSTAPAGDVTSIDYAQALSARATDYCDDKTRVITPRLCEQIKLLANAAYYLHSQKEISFFEKERDRRYINDSQWQYYQDFKPYMIWYNQLLSDYAYNNPRGTMSALYGALIDQARPSFPGEAEAVERHIKQSARGARTEAASRQLLDRTTLDYSPGTIDDDLHGGDLIVLHNGHRIKVDIKSSIGDVAAVRGGYEAIQQQHLSYAIYKARRDGDDPTKHVVVLFPGFADADFGDSLSLRLSEADAQTHAQALAAQLQLAFVELQL